VTAACQAQLVNVIAPIRTEPGGPAWRQTIFHPFAITSRLAKGEVLRVEPRCPTYETERFGAVPMLDAVATHDADSGDVTVFLVNRDQSQTAALTVAVASFGAGLRVAESWVLADEDLMAVNTADTPDRVVARPADDAEVRDGVLTATLPPVSWTAIRLATTRGD
jgi:alpha-N-arabinofuranosidase